MNLINLQYLKTLRSGKTALADKNFPIIAPAGLVVGKRTP